MTHCSSKTIVGLAAAGVIAALGQMAQAQVYQAAPIFPDPSLQPGYERSPQTTALNQSMLEQIERNPGAPMATAPFPVQPGATVTYPPQVQAPYPQLTPQPQR